MNKKWQILKTDEEKVEEIVKKYVEEEKLYG